jgi:hypothetical protein
MLISIFAGTFAVKDIPPQGSAHFKDPLPLISQHIAPFSSHFFLLYLLSIITALLPRLPSPDRLEDMWGSLGGVVRITLHHPLFTCQFQQTSMFELRNLADDLLETDSPMPTELPFSELSLAVPMR